MADTDPSTSSTAAAALPKIYINEVSGQDTDATPGTQLHPFKSLQFAYLKHPEHPADAYLVQKAPDSEWTPAPKSALKKAANFAAQQKKKAANQAALAERHAKEDAERQRVLDDAKKIAVTENPAYPKPTRIKLWQKDIKPGTGAQPTTGSQAIDYSAPGRGPRVRVFGRVHRERKQKDVVFITLRDGYGFLQCVFSGDLARSYDILTITRETSMWVTGELWAVPDGATAPDQRELHVDYYEIVGRAPGGDDAITNKVAEGGDPQTLLNQRHLTLRGEVASSVMIVRAAVLGAFRQAYAEIRCREVAPPALTQSQVEGGATLFSFNYYAETAYLTQSSQLYLETVLPSMGDVYCIEKSFRAENSLTRRHLAEYTHIEAELDAIAFTDLLDHLEHVMCRVIDITLADPSVEALVRRLNKSFQRPTRPFKRMRYSEAIDWLREHDIKNEDGNDHTFGDDIAEAAERRMTDALNVPILLTHFPVEIKAFYMMKDKEDRRVTESVDCLMPGVGEIVGGSMRIWDYEELMAAYEREGISTKPYYWYTDQRKYGTSPHGGYGLGLERFLAWMCGLHTVREACLYPRYVGRCVP